MQMQFVSHNDSPFYRSTAFSKVLHYANANLRRCRLKETGGRNVMQVADVKTVGQAVDLLRGILNMEVLTDA
jgi:transcription-repair coupling factor (superfamily II helicase)